jgi:hypothetical protein
VWVACPWSVVLSSGTPASSTTKTGRHDIAEILLKVSLKHKKSINQFLISTKKISTLKGTSNDHSHILWIQTPI